MQRHFRFRIMVPSMSMAIALFLAGCGGGTIDKAVAELTAIDGSGVTGTVTFTRTGSGISIEAHVNGLPPGDHGFHIHEFGDCSAPDGSSAGGHFNPAGVAHAGPDSPVRHVGDLGNLSANAMGHGMVMRSDDLLSFEGENSILDRAVVIHLSADDFSTQPTGAAGARLACGVIKAAK